MKKILLVLSFGFIHSFANSQCIPDIAAIDTLPPGQLVPIFPVPGTTAGTGDTLSVVSGLGYGDLFTIKIPTTVQGFITVDSVQLISIDNVPAGITYTCNTPNCVFQEETYGCVQFSGSEPTGSFVNIALNITVNGTLDVSGFFKPTFWLITGPLGVEVLNTNRFDIIQNVPNPFQEQTEIAYTLPNSTDVVFDVINQSGQRVYNTSLKGQSGVNTIRFDRSGLSSGTYFYSLTAGNKMLTGKMTIN